MKSSTWILFGIIRRRLLIGAASVFGLIFFIGFNDDLSAMEAVFVILTWSLLAAFFMQPHHRLSNTMFPVTHKQVAWISMAAWAILTIAALLGLTVAQLLRYPVPLTLGDIARYWTSVLWYLPAFYFAALVAWRSLQISVSQVWLIFMLPAFMDKTESITMDKAFYLELISTAWPVWIIGCIFLIIEAPYLTSVLRRLDNRSTTTFIVYFNTTDLTSPAKPSMITCIADAITWSLLILAGIFIISFALPLPAKGDLNFFAVIFLFCILAMAIGIAINLWRRNRASGMTRIRSFGVLLLEITGAGYAFREYLGVAPGAITRCNQCRQFKMVWHSVCPHCNNGNSTRTSATDDVPYQARIPLWQRDKEAFLFRRLIPGCLLVILLMNWINMG